MLKIKPGIMVSLSVRLNGGVHYTRVDIQRTADGSVTEWETKRVITNPVEHAAAVKARAKARSYITGVCAQTVFGLICPNEKSEQLKVAVASAREHVREFNVTSTDTQISISILPGTVAATEGEAIEAITNEARQLLGEMELALKAADVVEIRKAAARARQIGSILDGDAAEAVSLAIKEARKIARQVVRRVEKGGEDATEVLKEIGANGLSAIDTARFSLLGDIEEIDTGDDSLPSVNASRFSGLDLGDDIENAEPLPVVNEEVTDAV
jgi:hypothetical protein